MQQNNHTINEILSQPRAWEEALDQLMKYQKSLIDYKSKINNSQIIFTGCGSTYYLAQVASAITQKLTGICARAFPASELWLNPLSSYSHYPVQLIAISRSGETTETIRACQKYLEKNNGSLITFTCYDQTPLSEMGVLNVVLPSGQEKSVAQTRAFSVLLLGTIFLASIWADNKNLILDLQKTPTIANDLIQKYQTLARDIGTDNSIDRFYWLGSGPRFGLASELSLKMKEMSLSHSEPFHFLEFRHGPKSMVTQDTQVIGLNRTNYEKETEVLKEIKSLGGRTLRIADQDGDISFGSEINPDVSNVLYLPIGQLIAYYRAIGKGLDPDHPKNLDTVVKILQ